MEVDSTQQALEIVDLLDFVIEAHGRTGSRLPVGSLKRSLSELRDLIQSTKGRSLKEGVAVPGAVSETSPVFERKTGLASRIRPVPAEVRGRVRELVDLISDEDSFDEVVDSN